MPKSLRYLNYMHCHKSLVLNIKSMKTACSYQHARYTAVVMLLVGLMTLGVGIANACLVSATHGHSGSALQVQTNSFAVADENLPDPDKTICLAVCAAEQTASINIKQFDTSTDSQIAPVTWAPALTISVVDIHDRLTPLVFVTWRERPVFIRFLRLTI